LKLLFVHDHYFRCREGLYYSDNLTYFVFQRYLPHFDHLTVFARLSEKTADPDTQSRACGEKVDFLFGPNISSFPAQFGGRQKEQARMKQVIKEHDAVVARLPSEYGLMAAALARRMNRPCLLEAVACPWDALWNYGGLQAKLYAPVLMYRMRRAVSKGKFVSYVSRNFLQKRYPPNTSAMTVSVSNVEIPKVDMLVLEKRINKINSSGAKKVLGLIGSFKNKYKGVHTAIEALGSVNRIFSDWEFRILGSGDRTPYIELARQMGVEDKVVFDGTLPGGEAVFQWLDKVDIYVQPSFQEGVPRALIEAMSRGCPAIGSSAGGIPELLDPDTTFAPGDYRGLAIILERGLKDKTWQLKQARRNFETSKNYSKSVLDARRSEFMEIFKRSCK